VVRDSYHVFLPITAADFEVVGASDTAWLVVCDGLVGQIVHGRVAKDGDWVDLSHVGFATH